MAVYGLWEKNILIAVLLCSCWLSASRRLIHTDLYLLLPITGCCCFSVVFRVGEILLKDITSVERTSSMQIGGFAVMRYVLVRYGEGKCVALLPVKEEEFIRLLKQSML